MNTAERNHMVALADIYVGFVCKCALMKMCRILIGP